MQTRILKQTWRFLWSRRLESYIASKGEVFYFRVSRSPTDPNLGPDCKIKKPNLFLFILLPTDSYSRSPTESWKSTDKEKQSYVPWIHSRTVIMGSKTSNITGVLFFFTCFGLWKCVFWREKVFFFISLFYLQPTDRSTFLVPWLRETQKKIFALTWLQRNHCTALP